MSAKILLIGSLALFLSACGETASPGQTPPTENKTAALNVETNTTPAPAANTQVNEKAEAKTEKPFDNGPKRIVFNKGANRGAVNVTLPAGAAQRFVVGARSEQVMSVESSSKDISINLLKGNAQTTEDFGFLRAELRANGDYVFEVRNSTRKEMKASVKVMIENETFQRGVLNDVDEENEKEERQN